MIPKPDPLGYVAMMFTAACMVAVPFLMAWVVTKLTRDSKSPVLPKRRVPRYKRFCERHLLFLRKDELCVIVPKEECDGCKGLVVTNVLTLR